MRSTRASATERCTIAAERRAALPGGARRGEHDAAHCEVEVGRRGDDRRIVAAEFQQHLAEPLRDARADLLPIRTEPVALSSATRGSSTSCSPTSRPPGSAG